MNSRLVFGTIICAIFVLAISSAIALGQDEQAAYRLITADAQDTELTAPGHPAVQSENSGYLDSCNTGCNQSCDTGCGRSCGPWWTASADFIVFDRIGGTNQTLVQSVPVRSQLTTGAELLNGNDFRQGFYGGPRVSLIRHGERCYDLELLYFQIDGWNSTRLIAPPTRSALVFNAPGNLNYRTTNTIQFNYDSKLYNSELNVRWNPLCRVTMLAGFRWVELREDLEGGIIAPLFEPFWITRTKNDLYGFQIGTDAKIWERGCFSIDGLVKGGIFGNHAEQTSTIIDSTITRGSSSTNHTAFLGELGVQCKYQVNCNLTLRAGYEAMWLQGVALAPGQIHESNFSTSQFGIDTNSGVFYHGATAGFEYAF
jgi:hypothetical protein